MHTLTRLMLWILLAGCLALPYAAAKEDGAAPSAKTIAEGAPIQYRVGFLGAPKTWSRQMNHVVPWTKENLQKLKDLGFNTIQVNVAWGSRPDDESLNLEDVVRLDEKVAQQYPQPVKLRCTPGEEAFQRRRGELRDRSAACKALGLRTIFHFGAPYNAHATYQGTEPNCILDEKVSRRYELLLNQLSHDFPQIDDILVYTYDQDAWLCSEFANCPRCAAVPLHERLPGFLNRLSAAWRKLRPQGRMWWEPWELSAGECYQCLERVDAEGLGLALHVNIAEVMATLPVDRWVKNTTALAGERRIPVLMEYFLGGTSEELEPLLHLAHPLVTLRGLQAISRLPGVVGIKEYYGLTPDLEDTNLRMTGILFSNPGIREDEALRQLAAPYGQSAEEMAQFWRLCSSAMELFPWDAAWMIRCFGNKPIVHSLDAAARIPPIDCESPSWRSNRQGIYLRTAPVAQDHPWLTEDIQLRMQMAVTRWKAAEALGGRIAPQLPAGLKESFAETLRDTGLIRRRAASFAYHLRETNLARLMRSNRERPEAAERARREMLEVLRADKANYAEEKAQTPASSSGALPERWRQIDDAMKLLENSPENFLARYLR